MSGRARVVLTRRELCALVLLIDLGSKRALHEHTRLLLLSARPQLLAALDRACQVRR